MTPGPVQNNAPSTKKKVGGITGKGFLPGQSGNPGGKPKTKPITEIYERLLADGANVAAIEETVKTILRKSGMGAVLQLKEMAERTEGKVSQKVEVDGTLNISLAETIQKARKRAQQK